jgi:hypothetical protein
VHVHTLGTVHANTFTGWDDYLGALEEAEDVAALGITDYLIIENYKKIRQLRDGRLANIPLVFPNIEFRITPATRHGRGINLHLLISPDDPEHVQKIEEALAQLTFEYRGEVNYTCTPPQLRALGHAFNPNLVEHAALRGGVNQFKVEFRAIRDWLRRQPWLY